MKSVKIISDDRIGLLADVSYILAKSNLNMDALCVEVLNGKAVIAISLKDPIRANSVLFSNGFKTLRSECIVIKISTNSSNKIHQMLQERNVSIKNFTSISSNGEHTLYTLEVDKPRKALRILSSFIVC